MNVRTENVPIFTNGVELIINRIETEIAKNNIKIIFYGWNIKHNWKLNTD